jgi:hypothetical protein
MTLMTVNIYSIFVDADVVDENVYLRGGAPPTTMNSLPAGVAK